MRFKCRMTDPNADSSDAPNLPVIGKRNFFIAPPFLSQIDDSSFLSSLSRQKVITK